MILLVWYTSRHTTPELRPGGFAFPAWRGGRGEVPAHCWQIAGRVRRRAGKLLAREFGTGNTFQVERRTAVAREFAKWFYNSAAWRRCRNAFFRARFGLCERCGKPGLIVHHKKLLTPENINDPTVTLNWDNLELLCQDCHNREHGGASTAEGVAFDQSGDVIHTPPLLEKDRRQR